MTQEADPIFKIVFMQQNKLYEIYARGLSEGALMGFIEIEELVFDNNEGIVVDPTAEQLKTQFKGVERSYIPLHHILRIDEVSEQGIPRIKDMPKEGNVTYLPHTYRQCTEE